jgi:hypothetical protein
MEWQIIVALAIAIPIILFPVALIWYINIGGIYSAIKEARAQRATRKKGELISGQNTYQLGDK